MIDPRPILALLLAVLVGSVLTQDAVAQQTITVTDVAGRTVTLDGPAERVLVGDGRQLIALSLIHPDPPSIIAGWLGGIERLGGDYVQRYEQRFPHISDIPDVGVSSAETFSVESAISVRPDMAIFGGGEFGLSPESSEIIQTLEAAGIPVVFVDFRQKPFKNTVPSMTLLGKALGREEAARAFTDYYQRHLDRIAERLDSEEVERPDVLLEMFAGGERGCCGSPGKGNLGDFIDFAGGHNIGADVLPGPLGQLNLEYVIAQDPDVYIGTGVPDETDLAAITIGDGVAEETARRTLAGVIERPGIADLAAVDGGRVHALWHNFYNSPMNLLAVEAMAKWFHPELFADLDPSATMAEINERFLAVPLQGTYWVNLNEVGRPSAP